MRLPFMGIGGKAYPPQITQQNPMRQSGLIGKDELHLQLKSLKKHNISATHLKYFCEIYTDNQLVINGGQKFLMIFLA